MNINLIISLALVITAQVITYLQLQSQFFWPWAKENPILLSCFGMPISLVLIYYTKYSASAFDGEVWPGRIIGFAIGAIVFALLSHFIMGESFSNKTMVSLILSTIILLIQIFWK